MSDLFALQLKVKVTLGSALFCILSSTKVLNLVDPTCKDEPAQCTILLLKSRGEKGSSYLGWPGHHHSLRPLYLV